MNTVLRRCFAVMLSLAAPAALADSGDADFFGLLRARDITPFGFLRLDMRPAKL